MATDFFGLPGYTSGNTLVSRNIFTNANPAMQKYVPSLAQINGSLSRDTGGSPTDLLRAGLIMGKITSSGFYRPAVIGLTSANYTSGSTTISAGAAVITELTRLAAVGSPVVLNIIGPPTAAGTVATIQTTVSNSALTSTSFTVGASLGANVVSGSIIAPADGSQIPKTVLPNASGIDVLNTNGDNINQPLGQYLIGADLIASQIVNLTECDASCQVWLKQNLNQAAAGYGYGGGFTFDNDRP